MPAIQRNNVLAGLFVVTGLALGVWVSFLLGDRTNMKGLRFTVRFTIEDGATGLKPGSPVLLGGTPVGRVTSVRFAPATSPGGPTPGVDVGVDVRSDLILFENATIALERPLLGTLSSVGIRSVGNERTLLTPPADQPPTIYTGTPLIESGETITGSAVPALLAQTGLTKAQIAEIGPTISSIKASAESLRTVLNDAGPEITQSVKEGKAFITSLNARLAEWETHVNTLLADLAKASAQADPLLTEARGLIKRADESIVVLTDVVAENRSSIRQTLASVESLTAKADRTLLDPLLETLLEADRSLEAFTRGINDVRTLLGESGFDIKHTIANFRLASEQLKLAAVEVRSSPWRLMYKPSLKERETEDVYGAASAFANAASNVRAAAETLAAATKSATPTTPLTPERLAELVAELDAASRLYRDSGSALMDALVDLRKNESR